MATNPGDDNDDSGDTKPSGTAYQNYVNIEPPSASAPNASAVTTPVIIQYPKPPRRDDGKWMAIGSMVGSLFGLLYSADMVKKAKAAEDKWKDLTDHFFDKGKDIEEWAESLRECDNKLHEALCNFALCGYTPDYKDIVRRASQSAQLQVAKAYRTALKTSARFNTGLNRDVYSGILKAGVLATVQASTMAFEGEREKAWRYKFEVLSKTTQVFESDYINRIRVSADYLTGAGTNYGFLAQSYRATAKADTGDIAALGSMLGVILPIAFNFGCSSDSYCDDGCGSSEDNNSDDSNE